MLDRLVTATIGLGGAFAAAQFPAYYTQYLQRLGGAMDEAVNTLARNTSFLATLKSAGQSADGAQILVDQQAERVQVLAQVFDRVDTAKDATFEKLAVLFDVFDTSIGREAWAAMEYAIPLSRDGLIFAAFGFCAALVLWLVLKAIPREGSKFLHWLRSLLMMRVRSF